MSNTGKEYLKLDLKAIGLIITVISLTFAAAGSWYAAKSEIEYLHKLHDAQERRHEADISQLWHTLERYNPNWSRKK